MIALCIAAIVAAKPPVNDQKPRMLRCDAWCEPDAGRGSTASQHPPDSAFVVELTCLHT